MGTGCCAGDWGSESKSIEGSLDSLFELLLSGVDLRSKVSVGGVNFGSGVSVGGGKAGGVGNPIGPPTKTLSSSLDSDLDGKGMLFLSRKGSGGAFFSS